MSRVAATAGPVVVAIPLYKPVLDPLEQYSLDASLPALAGRELCFVAPEGLAMDYYTARYPGVPCECFDAAFFGSIQGYNRLLLSTEFYVRFAAWEFMLLLQPDAIVLHDDLDHWCAQAFDYVGAPWPDAVELFVNLGRFEGERGRRVRALVGNGGFSLRRIAKQVALLQEFPEAVDYFRRSGSSEDLFFSLMGLLSHDYVLPNEITASRFALELKPSFYFAVNGGRVPMGAHAWWKYEPGFWRTHLQPQTLARLGEPPLG